MAGKNEILLSIKLEGDGEVKSKLKSVGEEGKAALEKIDKNISSAKSSLSELHEPLGKVREALAPLLEGAGASSGLGALGGLGATFARFGAGLVSPAGLVAGLAGALVQMAKLGEETERSKQRLAGLGGGKNAFDDLNQSAKKLGTTRDKLQPGLEDFLTARREARENGGVQYAPGAEPSEDTTNIIGGGRSTAVGGVSQKQFEAAQRTLLSGSKIDGTKTDDALAGINKLFSSIYANKGLVADAVRDFQRVSPKDANRLARDLGPVAGRNFTDASQLAKHLDNHTPISPDEVFRGLAKDEPNAQAEAAARHGLSDAFDGVTAAAGRLTEAFGGDHAGLVHGLDSIGKLIEDAAAGADKMAKQREINNNAAPKSLSEVLGSKDFMGALTSYIRQGQNGKENGFGGANPFGVITDFAKKAFTDPGSIGQPPPPPEPGPKLPTVTYGSDPDFKGSVGTGPEFDGKFVREPGPYNFLTAPEQPTTPEQHSQADTGQQAQQLASLGTAIQSFLEGIASKIPTKKEDLQQTGPATGGGIRGEGDTGEATKGVAELNGAASEAAASLREVASAGHGPTEQTVNAASGGYISGAGSATSDSIPARLSDGEYVVRASRVSAVGRDFMDRFNAGGVTSRRLSRVRKYADGGQATELSPGDHQITASPDGGAIIDGAYYPPGSPILQDPEVQAALKRSEAEANQPEKRKKKHSEFVGRFGHDDSSGASDTYVRDGGHIVGYDGGGTVRGPGTATSDDIPAYLSHGEFVVNARETGRNLSALHAINNGKFPQAIAKMFANGGLIDIPRFADGGWTGGKWSLGRAPSVSDAATGSASAGHFNVDLRTNHGDFSMLATEDVARKMSAAARDSSNAQTGQRPSWYKGR